MLSPEYYPQDIIGDIPLHPETIGDFPEQGVLYEFSFKRSIRDWWMRVGDEQCQYEFYTERRGWQQCNKPARDVHHIIPESQLEYDGLDTNHAVGMPLCQDHHTRNTGEDLGSYDSSFHPDMGNAFGLYKSWKQMTLHMNEILGKKAVDYSTSPFADVAKGHRVKATRGERIVNGDFRTDEYYLEKMISKAVKYIKLHPDDPKPK